MVGFFRTLLIILLIYYVLKFLARLFMPFLLRKMAQKVEKTFKQQQQQNANKSQQQKSTKNDADDLKVKKQVGEYIDYEEVD